MEIITLKFLLTTLAGRYHEDLLLRNESPIRRLRQDWFARIQYLAEFIIHCFVVSYEPGYLVPSNYTLHPTLFAATEAISTCVEQAKSKL